MKPRVLIVWNEDSICLTAVVTCTRAEGGEICFAHDFEVGEDAAELIDRVMLRGWCSYHDGILKQL